jgi:hypothetical protein
MGQRQNPNVNPQMMRQQMPMGQGMPMQQPQVQQQQPTTPAEVFNMKAQQLIPSVQERNPYLKEHVGHLIYEFVDQIVGNQFAPKITGMLIELPVA